MTGVVGERSTAEAAERLVRRLDGVVDVVSELRHRVDDGGLAHPR
jgi:osmotically-inducible protein OsmY